MDEATQVEVYDRTREILRTRDLTHEEIRDILTAGLFSTYGKKVVFLAPEQFDPFWRAILQIIGGGTGYRG